MSEKFDHDFYSAQQETHDQWQLIAVRRKAIGKAADELALVPAEIRGTYDFYVMAILNLLVQRSCPFRIRGVIRETGGACDCRDFDCLCRPHRLKIEIGIADLKDISHYANGSDREVWYWVAPSLLYAANIRNDDGVDYGLPTEHGYPERLEAMKKARREEADLRREFMGPPIGKG